jgi:D-alanyl-D-alanine carboxypeptidase (penicillin-binding protein 5/6)
MNRFEKNVWLILVLVMIVIMIYPSQILCKTDRISKTPKASQKARIPEKVKTAENKQAPSGSLQCDARSAILMDGVTGQVLFEQNSDLKISPASFVKVMTLYLIYDAIRAGQLKMDDAVTVSEKAWKIKGSKMFIKVGERVKVEDLIKGVTIASGNDACIALAEHLSGSEEAFVSKMNEKAKLLGLKDTQFKNSHGMPAEGQYMTAMEMAILS